MSKRNCGETNQTQVEDIGTIGVTVDRTSLVLTVPLRLFGLAMLVQDEARSPSPKPMPKQKPTAKKQRVEPQVLPETSDTASEGWNDPGHFWLHDVLTETDTTTPSASNADSLESLRSSSSF
jgi:hypothetical protein